jgi:hypothetical protein
MLFLQKPCVVAVSSDTTRSGNDAASLNARLASRDETRAVLQALAMRGQNPSQAGKPTVKEWM